MSQSAIVQARLRNLTEQVRELERNGVTEVSIDVLVNTLDFANLLAARTVTLEEVIRQQRTEKIELIVDRASERMQRRVAEAFVGAWRQ